MISTAHPESFGRRLAGMSLNVGRLDGIGLRDFDRSSLRSALRHHSGRSTMFSGSVRELVDPRGTHSDADIEAVLHVAAADDVVARLDGGLDAHVHADGRSLSGGQRQRLALARSLLGDPPYLVLVEPTTALDAVTEIEVAARVAARRSGCTTLVLTHGGAFHAVADQVIDVDADPLPSATDDVDA